jgi:prevent-host-death family protein
MREVATMIQVGIAELKAHLSEFLVRVQQGEEIVVADRGRPVARLVPAVWSGADQPDSQLFDLQRRGLVRVGTGTLPDEFWEIERPSDPRGLVAAALEEERAEGY